MKSYWNNNGEEQSKYAEMRTMGWKFTQKTMTVFHYYYRYYNDGDIPGWARARWDLKKAGHWGWELNEAGLKELEDRATEAIRHEYERYSKHIAKEA